MINITPILALRSNIVRKTSEPSARQLSFVGLFLLYFEKMKVDEEIPAFSDETVFNIL